MPEPQREAEVSPSSAYPAPTENRNPPEFPQAQSQNATPRRTSAPTAPAATSGPETGIQDRIQPTVQAIPTPTLNNANGHTQQSLAPRMWAPSPLGPSQGNPSSTLNNADANRNTQRSQAYRTGKPPPAIPTSTIQYYMANGHPLPAIRRLKSTANTSSKPINASANITSQPNLGPPAPAAAPQAERARKPRRCWCCCQCGGKFPQRTQAHIDWTTNLPCSHGAACELCMWQKQPKLCKTAFSQVTEKEAEGHQDTYGKSFWEVFDDAYDRGNYNPVVGRL